MRARGWWNRNTRSERVKNEQNSRQMAEEVGLDGDNGDITK